MNVEEMILSRLRESIDYKRNNGLCAIARIPVGDTRYGDGMKYAYDDTIRVIDMLLKEHQEKKMGFKGDIIITDPCYIMKPDTDDWDRCEWGSNMETLGIHNYLTRDTNYGDWGCAVVDQESGEKLGGFCADAGLVSVFLLEDVLRYNPEYEDVKNKRNCVTLIENFDGEISIGFEKITPTEDYEDEFEIRVVGTGNKNFYSTQTGF